MKQKETSSNVKITFITRGGKITVSCGLFVRSGVSYVRYNGRVARRPLSKAQCLSGLVGRSYCQVPIFLCFVSELTHRIWHRYTLLSPTFKYRTFHMLVFIRWNFVRLFLWEFIISTAGIRRDRGSVSFTEILKVLREPSWQGTSSKRDTTYPQEGLKLCASKGKAIPLQTLRAPIGWGFQNIETVGRWRW